MFRYLLSLHIAVIFCLFGLSSQAADLIITIEGVRNDRGMMRLALFDEAKEFPRGKDIRDHDAPAKKGTMVVVLKDINPGIYALALHHDENTNKKMDSNFIGMPKEGYGFANNARVIFGPPNFEAAAFKVGTETTSISLRVVY